MNKLFVAVNSCSVNFINLHAQAFLRKLWATWHFCLSRKLRNFHKSYFEEQQGMAPSDLANNRNVSNK